MLLRLIFYVPSNHICGHFIPYTPDKVAITPQLPSPKLSSQSAIPLEHLSRRYTLQYLHHFRRRIFRWYLQKYMHMIFHHFQGIHPKPIFLRYSLKHLFCVLSNLTYQDVLPILWYPHQMVLDIKNSVLCPSNPHASFIQEKAILKQTPFAPDLRRGRFPPASKLAGIQRSFL